MERDILLDILERKAALLARPGRGWTETVSLAAAALMAGVNGRWPPAGLWQLQAGLARAGAVLRASPPEAAGAAATNPNS